MNRLLSSIALAALAVAPMGAQAQQRSVEIIAPGQGVAVQHVNLALNKALIVNLPRDARDVVMANPGIVDAVIRTPRQAYVLGLSTGDTSVFFLDGNGNQILDLEIRVDRDISSLHRMLERYVPEAIVGAEAIDDDIVLTGTVPSALAADRAVQLAERFVDAPENILSLLSIDGAEQVMLKVRVVEMQRSLLKQLGFGADVATANGLQTYSYSQSATFGVNGTLLGGASICGGQDGRRTTSYENSTTTSNSTTTTTTGSTNSEIVNGVLFEGEAPSTITVEDINGNLVTIPGTLTGQASNTTGVSGGTVAESVVGAVASGAVSSAFDRLTGTFTDSCFGAFERSGLVRTLAEPNITAISGETARFQAGGEFPVPAGRDRDGNITIEFKRYGVGLSFTPVVLSGGRVSLKIATEVSDLTNQGSVQLQGVSVPALAVRSAETTVELPSGGAIMLAGLIQDRTRQSIGGVPGAMDVPVLGAGFRSDDFVSEQTELVVIATPYLVNSTSPDALATPIDGLDTPDGPEAFLLGRLNKVYAAPGAEAQGQSWQGPMGFVTEPGRSDQ